MTHKSEVRLIVDPTGLTKIELYGLPNDTESKEAHARIVWKASSGDSPFWRTRTRNYVWQDRKTRC